MSQLIVLSKAHNWLIPRGLVLMLVGGLLWGCATAHYDEGKADALLAANRKTEALKHYEYLAEFGLPSAQKKLAKLYLQQGDDVKARNWYRQATLREDEEAKLRLARLLIGSKNPKVYDPEKGSELLVELLGVGESRALSSLARFSRTNTDFSLSPQALETIRLHTAEHDRKACFLYGQWLNKTFSAYGPLTADQSEELFKTLLCAYPDFPGAIVPLAKLFHDDSRFGGIEQCLKLIENGVIPGLEPQVVMPEPEVGRAGESAPRVSTPGVSTLGVETLVASSREPKYVIKSVSLLRREIAAGKLPKWGLKGLESLYALAAKYDTDYTIRLAKLYLEYPQLGEGDKTVLKLLNHCPTDVAITCANMQAQMYLFGELVIQDPWQAEKLLLAIQEPDPYTFYLLGKLYASGYLGEAHLHKGLSYLERSAEQNFREADKALFSVYISGVGLPVEPVRALAHFILTEPKEEILNAKVARYGFSEFQISQARLLAEKMRQQRNTRQVVTSNES